MRLPQPAFLAASSSRQAIQEARNTHSDESLPQSLSGYNLCVRDHWPTHSSYQGI